MSRKYGPFEAVFLDNYDGDTLTVLLFILPGLQYEIDIRLHGVDTPELYGDNHESAERARDYVFDLCRNANTISVTVHGYGKYAGRLIGTVVVDGRELGELLLMEGLAEPYVD